MANSSHINGRVLGHSLVFWCGTYSTFSISSSLNKPKRNHTKLKILRQAAPKSTEFGPYRRQLMVHLRWNFLVVWQLTCLFYPISSQRLNYFLSPSAGSSILREHFPNCASAGSTTALWKYWSLVSSFGILFSVGPRQQQQRKCGTYSFFPVWARSKTLHPHAISFGIRLLRD